MKKEKYIVCSSCGTRITIGEDFRYDSDYNGYCNDFDCVDGIATQGTGLEPCWFGDGEEDHYYLPGDKYYDTPER
jgi:hypothetical protein